MSLDFASDEPPAEAFSPALAGSLDVGADSVEVVPARSLEPDPFVLDDFAAARLSVL